MMLRAACCEVRTPRAVTVAVTRVPEMAFEPEYVAEPYRCVVYKPEVRPDTPDTTFRAEAVMPTAAKLMMSLPSPP